MRIFVYEFVTGGGLQGEPLRPGLVREGRLMADRLVEDITALPGVEVLVSRDPRISHDFPADVRVLRGDADAWHRGLAMSDAVWPVAPESGGLLTRLTQDVEASGRRLLSSRSNTVAIATSKRHTATLLAAAGVRVVPTARPGEALPDHEGPWVVKPDDGVGCEGIRIMASRRALCRWMQTAEPSAWVVQPLLEGEPLSLTLLCMEGRARILSVNRQRVSRREGGFVFEGCQVNIPVERRRRALEEMADRVAACLPGLYGLAGVDLLWTGDGPCLLEVNPRLTTPCAGLREALSVNPAALVLGLDARGLPSLPDAGRMVTLRLHIPGAVDHV